MGNFIVNVVIRRVQELLLLAMILSVPMTFICIRYGASDTNIFMILLTGVIIYMFLQLRFLRQCYFDVYNLSAYYLSNFIASGLFALIHFCGYRFLNNEIYTWLFSITKFARYGEYGMTNLQSVLIFHGIILMLVLLASVDIRRMLAFEEEE